MLTMKQSGKTTEVVSKVKKNEPKMHFVQKVIGNDTYLVMAQSAVQLEDEFSSLYYTAANQNNLFLMPPFDPTVLLNLTQTNNVLNQCVEAMEVNIDGTGHDFVPSEDGKDMDKAELAAAQAFFNEPYPNTSFVKIRRKLRRQLESTGYAFLEVLRNVAGDVVGLRNVDTHHVRFVKLGAPVLVKKKVMRGGKEVELQLWERERAYAQRVAMKTLVYYREFGSTRDINRNTGDWAKDGETIAPENRGTELLVFGIHPDNATPYFLPRWINQMPSVVGSRKAEEQNLEFLDSGGLPPAIIFVQGGSVAKDSADQLKNYLSGKNKNKYRAVVVEAMAASGSLDSNGTVNIKTERFGPASAQDSMFGKYDVLTEEHTRVGFRLPPLFLGKPADYNMATAITAYMVAEEQVFQPERNEFDEVINKTIMKALGIKTLKIKSRPITLKDVSNQITAMGMVKDLATRESFLKEVNDSTGMSLELSTVPHPNVAGDQEHPGVPTVAETPHEKLPASTKPASVSSPQPTPEPPKVVGKTPGTPPKAPMRKSAMEIIELVESYASAKGLLRKADASPERALVVKAEVDTLLTEDRDAFNTLLAQYAFGSSDPNLISLVKV